VREIPDRWTDLGEFIRQQREMARLSLRRLSEIAGISNPYLSQIERGLRRPSAEILQKIAAGLRISGEALYIRAGILDADRVAGGDLISQILAAPDLDEAQRQILIRIYLSFRAENSGGAGGPVDETGEAGQAASADRDMAPGNSRS
jgi:transcriptional regulator with XRE-family HTH domain